MIQISQVKVKIEHTKDDILKACCRQLRISSDAVQSFTIVRRSVDARKKDQLHYSYTVQLSVKNESQILKKCAKLGAVQVKPQVYRFPKAGEAKLKHRPVIVGSGPAGLFCAYQLAKHGYCPILLEQGDPVEVRKEKVDSFWESGVLDPMSNVQFGEGGAGTFSDGKLNTGVKDKNHRNQEVLKIFHEAGGKEEILYDSHPHLGTDELIHIVKSMRKQIEAYGGEVHFRSKLTELLVKNGAIEGICINGKEMLACEQVVLAIGHSARDTFSMLHSKGVTMHAKSFAVGVRVEHPQTMITENQYGEHAPSCLGPASYKLTHTLENGRGVYSFCMCPGGYVVNASSEEGHLAVNGMSYSKRDSANANSAIVVTVNPEDFAPFIDPGTETVFAGLSFQRYLEKRAYEEGRGAIPVQRYEDFCLNKKGGAGSYAPCMKGNYTYANVRSIFPPFIGDSLADGIKALDRKIHGFAAADTLLSGVESRTSSPVRIDRDDAFESNIKGLYPCGEGAGYAGGITSAAMDGLKLAEAIASKYQRFNY